jgi:uncharacterized protein YaaQ
MKMRLMIVILSDDSADEVITALLKEEYRVTRVASTGGFFRRGNTTLFIGTDEDRVDRALEIIREMSRTPEISGHGRATVFVLKVDRFETL